jgi:PAS domain S-box-containing protein
LSQGLYALLGLKTKTVQLSLKSLLHFIHPEDQRRFKEEWKLAIDEGLERIFEFQMVRNGQLLHIKASLKIFMYAGRSIFIGTLQDATAQEELKNELAQRSNICDAVTEYMPGKALLTNEENTIVFWNREAEITYGITREEAVNQNFFDVFPLLKTAEALQLFQRAWNGELVRMPGIKTPGTSTYHDLLMIPIRTQSGTISGIMHLARDVTKEHEMERVLTERAHFIEALVEASENRLIVMDRHMNYLYCNEQAANFYGLTKEQIIGKNVLEVFPGTINDTTFDHFRSALRGETVKIHATEGVMKEQDYEVHLLPIKDDSGMVTAVVWTHYKGG